MAASAPAPPTEQQRLLAEHKEALLVSAASMRRAGDARDVRGLLAHALTMLEELRTGSLTPKVRRGPSRDARAPFAFPLPDLVAPRTLSRADPPRPPTPSPVGRCTTSSSSSRSTS